MILKRKTSKGKPRYGVRVDRPGGRQEWIGTFATIAEARAAERRAGDRPGSSRMTADKYVAHFLEGYRERVKGSSYDHAVSALGGFADDHRGLPLARITRTDAEKWARENRWRVPTVITVMNAAVDAELIERNPFRGLAVKGQGRKRITPLSVEEVDALATAAEKEAPTLGPLVLFLAYSGVRVGEAYALEWSDVDFEAARVTVERRVYKGQLDLPKGNRTRSISLIPAARSALLSIPGPRDGLIFRNKRGDRLSQTSMAWYWKSIATAVDRKVTPHELRHFAAHHLYVEVGLPDRVVAAQLGHDDGGKLIRDLYGHGDVGALDEIDAAFANVIPLRKVVG